MRYLVLLLALSAAACQGTPRRHEHEQLVATRDKEWAGIEEKRKDAILDLSGLQPSNGEAAYLQRQAGLHHQR